jgi:glycosyltransferase involved in cell wall biosynthesis
MGKPVIYIFAPDLARPLGGMRMLYRHVDILNANGFEAAIVHSRPGFAVKWFEHSTRIVERPRLREEDIAVCSEIAGRNIATFAEGIRKVVFNQNAYYSFMGYPIAGRVKAAYTHPEVVATIVVSEDSQRYLQYAFPKHPIYRVRYSIDPKLYYLPERKKKQICFMPRKNLEAAKQVFNLLRFRKALEGWPVAVMDKLSLEAAAEVIRESLIFMSFGAPEGFGLPVAEALSAGCIVVGFHGNGGREFLTESHGFPIEVGDILGYARTMEEVIKRVETDLDGLRAIANAGAEFVRREYSPERERESITACWDAILGGRMV